MAAAKGSSPSIYSYLASVPPAPPAPPVRDASSLKGVRVGPGHEKFPSWPGSEQTDVDRPAPGGGSHRSKSWTDHTNYPKEKGITYSRPYMKRPSPAYTQQLKTVMERCEKIPPETYLPRVDREGNSLGDSAYMVPSPPERDKPQLTQADLEEYARSYQEEQPPYAQSEGYHSYVSSSDSTTTTPFLDRLRRDSEARVSRATPPHSWDEPPERDGAGRPGRDSVVTTSSGSASSSETLKWHGSLSDVSVASSACTHHRQLIAHSARVQTPQRHMSESVLYLGGGSSKLRLFPVSTYTVQPQTAEPQQPHRAMPMSSPSHSSLTVADRISELEKQQQMQTRYTYLDPEKRHRVSDPTLKAIQKKALLSFYERHHSGPAAGRAQAWRSEPQLAQTAPVQVASPQSPPPQPPPRPRVTQSSRRASSASDYAGGAWREMAANRELSPPDSSIKESPRHQHSSSCGSLSADLLGPLIIGPSISVDDWVPERPPKKPHLRAAFPLHDRMPSPDLPPPSPPPMGDEEVFASDEPLPPPPPDLHQGVCNTAIQDKLNSKCFNECVAEPQKPQDINGDMPTLHDSRIQIEQNNLISKQPESPTSLQKPSDKNVMNQTHSDNDKKSLKFCEHHDNKNSESIKQSDMCKNNHRYFGCCSLSPKQIECCNTTHSFTDIGSSGQKYTVSSATSQRSPDSFHHKQKYPDTCFKFPRHSDNYQRHLEHTSSLPRYMDSRILSSAFQRHCENNVIEGNTEPPTSPNRNLDHSASTAIFGIVQKNNESVPHSPKYCCDATSRNNDTCSSVNRFSNSNDRHYENKTIINSHSDSYTIGNKGEYHTSKIQNFMGNGNNRNYNEKNSPTQKFHTQKQYECEKLSQHQAELNNKLHSSSYRHSDSFSIKNVECCCSNQENSDVKRYSCVDTSLEPKYMNSTSLKQANQELFTQKHIGNHLGYKHSDNKVVNQKTIYPSAAKQSDNGGLEQKNFQTSISLYRIGSDYNSNQKSQEKSVNHSSDIKQTPQGHCERQCNEHTRFIEQKYYNPSQKCGVNNQHKSQIDSSGYQRANESYSVQKDSDSNIKSMKYSNKTLVPFSQQNSSTSGISVYRNTSHLYTRPQPLKAFDGNTIDTNSQSSKSLEGWSSMRYPTQKLVVNGKLATPLQNGSDFDRNGVRSGSMSMPARARLQRLPLVVPSTVNQCQTIKPDQQTLTYPEHQQGPQTQQRSTSKASYLAYRRDRDRGLPNFEGSYKRTMSPSGGQEESHATDCDRVPCLSSTEELKREPPTSQPTPPATPPQENNNEESCAILKHIESKCEPEEETLTNGVTTVVVETETQCDMGVQRVEYHCNMVESQRTSPIVTESLQLVQRSEVVLRVNAATSDAASQTEVEREPPAVLPARQKLQEEIECERLSLDLASQLPPTDKLQGLLVPDPDHKKPTDYVSDLFRLDLTLRPRGASASSFKSQSSTSSNCSSGSSSPPVVKSSESNEQTERNSNSSPASPLPANSVYFTTSESKAKFLTQYGRDMSQLNGLHDDKDLQQKKEELMLRLDRKLEVLREEHLLVAEESRINDELGESVATQVTKLARPHEAAKYRLHVEEVGKITSLLLGLSGRLARAENALMGLPSNHSERKILESKRDKLREQLEEAKKLKESIDRRSVNVSNILYKYFNSEEYADYDHFINMKAKLIMDSREIADKIKLGEEQLAALRETLSAPD